MVIHATTSNAAIVCQATQQRLRTTGIGSNCHPFKGAASQLRQKRALFAANII